MEANASLSSDELNRVSGTIVDGAIAVYRMLGPGRLESAYQACLAFELRRRGLRVASEMPLPVVYEGHKLEVGYRIDLLVADQVIVEVKAVDSLAPIHRALLLSYLRLSGRSLGLLQLQRRPHERRYCAHAEWLLRIHHRGHGEHRGHLLRKSRDSRIRILVPYFGTHLAR